MPLFNTSVALLSSHDTVQHKFCEQITSLDPTTVATTDDVVTAIENDNRDDIEDKNEKTKYNDETFSVTISASDGHNVTVHSVVPRGIGIESGPLGNRLVATETFHAGQILYRGYAALLDLSTHGNGFDLIVYDKRIGGEVIKRCRNSDVHSVSDKAAFEGARQVYGFDGFMNHSCDANTIHPLVTRTSDALIYNAVALRDIAIGEELTCDYAIFDYDCSGHEIEECLCGSTKCRGKMMGFKQLTYDEQINMMHLCEKDVVEAFFRDHADDIMLLQSSMPEGLALVLRDGDNHLVATRRFEFGEELFTNHAQKISLEDVETKRFVVEVDGRYIQLHNEHHFIYRSDYVENVGFDSFMDHSCDPNVRQTYNDATSYTCYARRTIKVGERITCNYTELDNTATQVATVKVTSFSCGCSSPQCIGVIHC